MCLTMGPLSKTKVFNPGKSSKLSLSPGQEIHGPGNKFHETRLENTSRGLTSNHPDLLANLKKKWNILMFLAIDALPLKLVDL